MASAWLVGSYAAAKSSVIILLLLPLLLTATTTTTTTTVITTTTSTSYYLWLIKACWELCAVVVARAHALCIPDMHLPVQLGTSLFAVSLGRVGFDCARAACGVQSVGGSAVGLSCIPPTFLRFLTVTCRTLRSCRVLHAFKSVAQFHHVFSRLSGHVALPAHGCHRLQTRELL